MVETSGPIHRPAAGGPSRGLSLQVLWVEMAKELLEVALEVVLAQGFRHILQVPQLHALPVPVLHHSPPLGPGFTHCCPGGEATEDG